MKGPPKPNIPPPELFLETDEGYEPYVIPAWSAAIASINRMRPAAEQNPPAQCFTFPPPKMSRANAKRVASIFTTWLHIRHHWIGQVAATTTEKPVALKAQTWRDILTAGIGGPLPTGLSGPNLSKTQRELNKVGLTVSADCTTLTFANGEVLKDEPSRILSVSSGNFVSWRNSMYDFFVQDGVAECVKREVLWEVQELNFRYDLLALDSVMGVASPDIEHLMEHQELFKLCWGGDSHDFYVPSAVNIPVRNTGLSSDAIDGRIRYLRHLYSICKTWPHFAMPAHMDDLMQGLETHHAVDLESQLYAALQQAFYDLHCRPMVPPRRLFQPV